MKYVKFVDRPLFLSCQPQLVERQLAGQTLSLAQAGPLRDDVSTDEITPVTVMLTYDEQLGRYPYVGLEIHGTKPIGTDAVRGGGFGFTVAGKRYGKGSSRESSPLAEYYAGIRLIIAESFERIYQQNCDNIGLLTSTDFGLIERIGRGEEIPMEEFLRGRDPLTQQIISAGGLMAFSKTVNWDEARHDASHPATAMTLVEKIIARNAHPSTPSTGTGHGVFVKCDWRFSHDYFTGMAAHFMHRAFGNPAKLHDPSTVIAFQDHLVLASKSVPHVQRGLLPGVYGLTRGHQSFIAQYPVRSHGQTAEDGIGAEGICHALMAEQYALPGQVIVGTDSHTPHSGALGCLAFGVGATDVANSWVTGYVRCKVPDTVRVEVNGTLSPGVMAKDVVLHLLQMEQIRTGGAIGAVFEFCGTAVRKMSIDERATLTNMVAELGGFTGIVAPDAVTLDYLQQRRGVEMALEDWMRSDPGASYRTHILIDGSQLAPMLARPGDPGNGIPAHALPAAGVPINIAYGGSCTGGKREDFDRYHEVFQWARDRRRRVASGVRLYLQFGTADVKRYCEERGYLQIFQEVGAEMVMPGCGACANCGPGQSLSEEDVTVSAINRNFPGRSGPGKVWLASPYTVAASAIAGQLTTFEQLMDEAV